MEFVPIYGDITVAIDDTHRFGTDAMLLSHFAMPCGGDTVCELGTGCGAIALRLAAGGNPAAVHGVDIQPSAIALAQTGADRFSGSPKPTFAVGDWTDPRSIAPAGSSAGWCAIRPISRRIAAGSTRTRRCVPPATKTRTRWIASAGRLGGCSRAAVAFSFAIGRSGCRRCWRP